MPDMPYLASKTRSNRPGWSVSFRHPLRRDARGGPGLKMRRGLGTTDEAEADLLIAEMNTLLADRTWWNASKRAEAELKFSKVIVDAFYDEIQAGREDPESLREELIPLPTAENGYSRVLFVGTTGAGKTSLLRQLIGSDPDKDRFPSTAPAKTTIADIEVIQSEGDFEAVVTFFSEFQTQASVEECITDACIAVSERAPIDKIADRFLNHRDQKFRLSYVLGGWRKADDQEADDDEFSFDDEPGAVADEQEDGGLDTSERAKNREVLGDFVDRIGKLTAKVLKRLSDDLGLEPGKPIGADREAAEQLIVENFEAYLAENETFHELVQDVLDRIRERFDLIAEGTLERHRSGWPKRWQFESRDREQFIEQIRWFSSNYWPQFGRLLTPLVSGIRVKGPLFPKFAETSPRLALIDGQGLGHTPDSSSSVTTHITKRFDRVDVILVVDNAQQPMQAAPLSVLRSVAASGHSDKLAVAFTHFDQIKGPNLRTSADKRGHVMASVLNALSNLRDVLGAPVVRSIEHGIEDRCFMLGGVDQNLSRLPGRAAEYMRGELANLVQFCQEAILPPPPPEASPIYDPTGISFAVREAVSNFQAPWLARLGLAAYDGVGKEHWTRVKALNRRIAGELDDEYDNLRPVADLVARMTESVSRFLDEPIDWTREPTDDQQRQASIARIRRAVSAAMHELALRRVVEQHLTEWREAYDLRGTGSTFRRARTIRGIYDEAAPIPDAVMPPPSKQFLTEVRRIVIGAIEASGGEVGLAEDD
ncbi:hypothetical protein ACSSVQ_003397 [Parvibaculum sp. MBR-TMA-1.3b-4.2]